MLAAQLGVRSVHAEPLLADDRVVAVLTVEPAAAGSRVPPIVPELAEAVSAAWSRRSETRRLAQSEVLLG
ncbi:MAG: hypothetical protein M3Q47_10600 [Actinomycetota bacterium]|nr:hypothetical protein [Actinomycetota bacterium]